MAFFGVKLRGEYVVFADDAGKRGRVVAFAQYGFGIFGGEIVAVDEIKTRVLGDALKKRVVLGLAHGVPAHMRDFQTASLRVAEVAGKASDFAAEPAQAVGVSFFAVVE